MACYCEPDTMEDEKGENFSENWVFAYIHISNWIRAKAKNKKYSLTEYVGISFRELEGTIERDQILVCLMFSQSFGFIHITSPSNEPSRVSRMLRDRNWKKMEAKSW